MSKEDIEEIHTHLQVALLIVKTPPTTGPRTLPIPQTTVLPARYAGFS
jgi:hypothetical protein